MALKIEFISKHKEYIPEPKPSLLYIPEEYKKFPKYGKDNLKIHPTVKKCIPFLDALITGYIIPFPCDIYYWYDEKNKQANFVSSKNAPAEEFKVTDHEKFQISEELRYSRRTIDHIFKFYNPWSIKTPLGYSCLFTTPFNRNLNFKLVDAIVDTDSFNLNANIPFYWANSHNQKVMLKTGDPMCLVIPFKRDSWKMSVQSETSNNYNHRLKKFFKYFEDTYKRVSWSKKSYK